MEIRRAEPKDLNNGLLCILDGFADAKIDENKAEVLLANMHGRTYVVVEDNRVIGTGLLFINQKLTHNGSKTAHIEDVVIDPEYRGKGYGKALINHLVNEAKRLRAIRVRLLSGDNNINFYEKIGFTKFCTGMGINFK